MGVDRGTDAYEIGYAEGGFKSKVLLAEDELSSLSKRWVGNFVLGVLGFTALYLFYGVVREGRLIDWRYSATWLAWAAYCVWACFAAKREVIARIEGYFREFNAS